MEAFGHGGEVSGVLAGGAAKDPVEVLLLEGIECLKVFSREHRGGEEVGGDACGAMFPDVVGGLVGELMEAELLEAGVEASELVNGGLEGGLASKHEIRGLVSVELLA